MYRRTVSEMLISCRRDPRHIIKVNHFSLRNISYMQQFKRICCILIQTLIFCRGYIICKNTRGSNSELAWATCGCPSPLLSRCCDWYCTDSCCCVFCCCCCCWFSFFFFFLFFFTVGKQGDPCKRESRSATGICDLLVPREDGPLLCKLTYISTWIYENDTYNHGA